MKIFGQISELVKILFRQNGQEITLDSNAATTYTADRTVQLPPGDSNQVLASATSTQTFTNKTIDGDDNTISDLALTSLKTALPDADKVIRRDASGVVISGNTIPNTSALVTTDATQTLTGKTLDGDSNTIQDLALASLKTVLADADKILQRDSSGAVISGPAIPSGTGDIVTLNGIQTLTQKTLTSPAITTPTGIVKGDVGLGNVDNTSDATKNAAVATLTSKTIDGDDNTITDLALTSLKTDLANASKVLARDASGIVTSANAVPNASALVTTDSVSVLTAKDIDGGTASDTSRITIPKADTATLNALTRKEGTLVYDTSVDKLKFDDGSTLNLVGSGSGSGSINYIANPDAEENVLGWATYADAAQVTPVDGTGGTANITFTRSTSSPLRGAASFLFTKDAANRQGQGASYDFTIASADVSKTLQISFDFENTGASYAAGDLTAYIYDVTNSTLLTPAAVSIAAAKYQFQTTFVATASTSYRLILHVASTNASAYTAKFDNVVVGPQLLTLGTTVQYLGSPAGVTVSSGVSAIAQEKAQGWRIGNVLRLRYSFRGTPNGSALAVSLPTGLNADLTALANFGSNYNSAVGTVVQATTGGSANMYVNNNFIAFIDVTAPVTNQIYFAINGASGIYTPGVGTSLINNGGNVEVDVSIPIAQWAGSGVYLSTAQPEYAYNSNTADSNDTTSFAYGPFGGQFGNFTAGRTKRVRFLTPIQETDKVYIEIFNDGRWLSLGESTVVSTYTVQGSTTYGMSIEPVAGNSSDIDVVFRTYRISSNATYGGVGATWAGIAASNTFKWRAIKIPGQVQVATPAQQPASEIVVTVGNGHGSTNTKIRRFTTIASNVGTDISYTDSATLGGSFTIARDGVYSISYQDLRGASACLIGASVNTTEPTTNINLVALANNLGVANTPGANENGWFSTTRRFRAGDVIRAHTDGTPNETDARGSRFIITQVTRF